MTSKKQICNGNNILPADLLFLILYKILILIQEILDNDVLRLFLGKSKCPKL